MRMFFALVLFLAIFISVNGDSIDDEEEKLPTKCHGKHESRIFKLKLDNLNIPKEISGFWGSTRLNHASPET